MAERGDSNTIRNNPAYNLQILRCRGGYRCHGCHGCLAHIGPFGHQCLMPLSWGPIGPRLRHVEQFTRCAAHRFRYCPRSGPRRTNSSPSVGRKSNVCGSITALLAIAGARRSSGLFECANGCSARGDQGRHTACTHLVLPATALPRKTQSLRLTTSLFKVFSALGCFVYSVCKSV
jgi:hypothetical protein